MRVSQEVLDAQGRWKIDGKPVRNAGLVLFFGGRALLEDPAAFQQMRQRHPAAILMGCSTAGEICDTRVSDDTIVATAIEFEHTQLQLVTTTVGDAADSRAAGRRLAGSLDSPGLVHVFVLSDGLHVNGFEPVSYTHLDVYKRQPHPTGAYVTIESTARLGQNLP